jgi:hypothetical protein
METQKLSAAATTVFSARFPMEPNWFQAQPCKGWSVNLLPARSAAVALPRNEVEAHALFTCDAEAATGAVVGF